MNIETKYASIDRDELKRLQADSEELAKLRKAATPSEDGGEAPEVAGYTTAGMLRIAKDLPLTGRIGAKCKADDRWNVPLMTVAQHSRIVAAKDAEIARIESQRKELALNLLNEAHELQQVRELAVELRSLFTDATEQACKAARERDELRSQLEAQPARQVGVDERECLDCNGTGESFGSFGCAECEGTGRVKVALAPAAVACVLPEPALWVRFENGYIVDHTNDWDLAEQWMQDEWPVTRSFVDTDEVARLNRRAIPAGQWEQVKYIAGIDPIKTREILAAVSELRALLGKS